MFQWGNAKSHPNYSSTQKNVYASLLYNTNVYHDLHILQVHSTTGLVRMTQVSYSLQEWDHRYPILYKTHHNEYYNRP